MFRYFDDYKKYTGFLTENKLHFSQTRFEENDIKKLIEIDELKKEGNFDKNICNELLESYKKIAATWITKGDHSESGQAHDILHAVIQLQNED